MDRHALPGIERGYTENEYFSNTGTAEFQAIIGEKFRSIPLSIRNLPLVWDVK